MRRLILDKIPQGMQPIMGVAYDGVLDIITEGEAPADALYVAKMENGQITVEKDMTRDLVLTPHTFAGWPEPEVAKKAAIEAEAISK